MITYKSYDIIGDIAVIKIPEASPSERQAFAKEIMAANKHVKTVLCQVSPVKGKYRTRELEWITGEKRTETVHREYGCSFKVDLAKVYFSPRLLYERFRIASQVKPGEVVINMFAGVGCFSIVIAKHSQASKIYSIDLNPDAIRLLMQNISLNKVRNRLTAILGDAEAITKSLLLGKADRILMPLPEKAYEYLDAAIKGLKPSGGLIHYYDFEHAKKGESPIEKVERKVSEKLERLNVDFEIPFQRIVRGVGPNWLQIVLDIVVKR